MRLSTTPLVRRGMGELLGTAMLLCAVVGSGIMASRLTSDVGLQLLINAVATFGLLLVVFALARTGRSHLAPIAVGAYIGAAYFFTSSTSFADPAAAP